MLFTMLSIWSMTVFAKRPLHVPMSVEEATSILDSYLERKNDLTRPLSDSIKWLKQQLGNASPEDALDRLDRLGNLYSRINTDSALLYYGQGLDLAHRTGDRARCIEFKLSTASLLPVNGVIRESVAMYESIDHRELPENLRRKYFEAGNRMYLFAESFYSIDSLRRKYHRLAALATDSLIKYETPGSALYNFYKAQAAHNHGDLPAARAGMRMVIESVPVEDNLYARAAAELAALTTESPDYTRSEHLYWLIMAAIGDIASGTRETTALQSVGMALYESGDMARAYRYLNESQDDAIMSGARIRTLQVAESLPIIAKTHTRMTERQHKRLVKMVWLLALAAVALTIVIALNLIQRRKMHTYEKYLKQTLAVKDDYIGRILSLCSNYIERLEEFNRMAGRKIKAGQVSELYDMIESGKMLQEQTHKFHELFDAAFIKVYPQFIEEVNSLLAEDRRFAAPAEGRLTPELRLLAFMRLGITDSPQLSRFLGLSLNTVYTYRNKLKNRAANRETFEENIRRTDIIINI